ncbi:LytTR family DNA-binding domain-containing protein [Altererythrobacter sp. MF3-039]|uniref:LytTR family DNA-binding domain-containing protein n=1 Tax=Altererythrobacter sp. MF3-039 TaxID=3252901 RepID=UPI00390CB930
MKRAIDFIDYWAELDWREFRIHAAIYVGAAIVLTMLGPFGTFDQPFVFRFTYWYITLSLFGGTIFPITAQLMRQIDWLQEVPVLASAAILMLVATIPMTLVIHLLDIGVDWVLLNVDDLPIEGIDAIRAEIAGYEGKDWPDILALYFQVMVIVALAIGLVMFVKGRRVSTNTSADDATIQPEALFFSRLPDHVGTELIYLQMEDHYLRVVTKLGEAMILMRFRDAMKEVETVGGLRVHRSWWVVTSEIQKYSRKGRKPELTMSNGSKVPVSESYKKSVEQLMDDARRAAES